MCKVEEVRAHLKKGVQRVGRQLFFLHKTLWRGALCKKNLERCFVQEKFGEVENRGSNQNARLHTKPVHKKFIPKYLQMLWILYLHLYLYLQILQILHMEDFAGGTFRRQWKPWLLHIDSIDGYIQGWTLNMRMDFSPKKVKRLTSQTCELYKHWIFRTDLFNSIFNHDFGSLLCFFRTISLFLNSPHSIM